MVIIQKRLQGLVGLPSELNNGFVIQYCKCSNNGSPSTVTFPLTNTEIYWIGHSEVFKNSTTNGIWAREIWIQEYTMATTSVYLSGGYKFISVFGKI